MLREERLLTAYLASAAGGPTRYVGRDMTAAHRISASATTDWAIFRGILADTLEALRVTERERQEVVAFAESLKADIVHAAPVAR